MINPYERAAVHAIQVLHAVPQGAPHGAKARDLTLAEAITIVMGNVRRKFRELQDEYGARILRLRETVSDLHTQLRECKAELREYQGGDEDDEDDDDDDY